MNLFILCALVLNSAVPTAQIVSDNNYSTTIQFTLPEYSIKNVMIDGKVYDRVVLPSAYPYLEKGLPELPRLYTSIVIDDNGEYAYRITNAVYETLRVNTIIPSKGNLTRDIDPEKIPYEFGPFYSENRYFPESNIDVSDPYIIRDYRGLTLHFNPFQFNPALNQLIVCKNITVEVYKAKAGGLNIKTRESNTINLTREFTEIYENFFLNFGPTRYDTVLERAGRMLIITADQYYTNILPFATWKRMKGMPVRIKKYSQIGTNYQAVRDTIQADYNQGGLVWILIVGDAENVPPAMTVGVSVTDIADPVYTLLEGGDYYPDAFISRFSANSPQDVDNQVARTITYERTLVTGGDWERKGMGVASNQTGSTPYADSTRCNWLRDMLLGYNYISVDRIYDPYGTIAMVSAGINEGRSVVNYIGHGSTTAWGSTGFSNTNVNQLTNVNKLPYIISVACINGNFDGGTCFAEAWLRAGTPVNPTGAIAFYGSSINQSWVPPTVAQSAACSLLVQNRNHTVGGLMFNGSCHMIASQGTTGIQEFQCWHIFGDASVLVRTLPPQPMTVNHQGALPIGMSSINVQIPGVHDALVGVFKDTLLYGSGYTDATGNVTINFIQPVTTMGYLNITVTAYNKTTYFDSIPVIVPNAPYVMYLRNTILDPLPNGNNNGIVNPGEAIEMPVWLKNFGSVQANNVRAWLRTTDPNITITDSFKSCGSISANDSIYLTDGFNFTVATACTNCYNLQFTLTIKDAQDSTWRSNIIIPVAQCVLTHISTAVNDPQPGGNNNGIINRGETVNLITTIRNIGAAIAENVTSVLSTTTPNVTIIDGIGNFGTINPNNSANNLSDPFTVSVDTFIAPGTMAHFRLVVTSSVYQETLQFSLPIEIYMCDFEASNGGYIPIPATGGWEWGIPTSGPSSAHSGTKLWATVLGGQYPNNANWTLTTPEITATGDNPQLKFWHWYNMEQGSSGTIYDGGNVKISTNNGSSWTVVAPVGGYTGTCYSSTPGVGGQTVFSGVNETWTEVTFNLPVNAGQTFLLRWHFGSDGSIQRAGWYIDDVVGIGFAVLPPPNNDVGIEAVIAPTAIQRVNVAVQPVARVKNYGLLSQTNFPVTCSIFGVGHTLRYTNTKTVSSIAANDTTRVTFDPWIPAATELCTVKIRTNLTGDQNPLNDLATRTTSVSMMFLAEGFNDVVFPPTGWQAIAIVGTYNWQRATAGTYPTCIPYEGDAMAEYRSWYAPSGNCARLISPPISVAGATPCSLKFWMMHDPGYATVQESIIIETSTNGTTFDRVAAFRRYAATQAWTEHTVYLGSFTSNFYLAFYALSGYGNNMYIDDARVLGGLPGIEQNSQYDVIITALYAPKPNPVTNGIAHIAFGIAEPSRAALKIYDASGRVVKTLVNGQVARGMYNMTWNGRDDNNRTVAEGIYFYTLETPKQNFTKKMVFTR